MKTITVKQQQRIATLIKELENKYQTYISVTFEHTDYGHNDGIQSKFVYYDDAKVQGHKYFDTPEKLIKFMEELI